MSRPKEDETAERVLEGLEIDPDLPAGRFLWNGPTAPRRRPGIATVTEEGGPRKVRAQVALSWARERSREVVLRGTSGREHAARPT